MLFFVCISNILFPLIFQSLILLILKLLYSARRGGNPTSLEQKLHQRRCLMSFFYITALGIRNGACAFYRSHGGVLRSPAIGSRVCDHHRNGGALNLPLLKSGVAAASLSRKGTPAPVPLCGTGVSRFNHLNIFLIFFFLLLYLYVHHTYSFR